MNIHQHRDQSRTYSSDDNTSSFVKLTIGGVVTWATFSAVFACSLATATPLAAIASKLIGIQLSPWVAVIGILMFAFTIAFFFVWLHLKIVERVGFAQDKRRVFLSIAAGKELTGNPNYGGFVGLGVVFWFLLILATGAWISSDISTEGAIWISFLTLMAAIGAVYTSRQWSNPFNFESCPWRDRTILGIRGRFWMLSAVIVAAATICMANYVVNRLAARI